MAKKVIAKPYDPHLSPERTVLDEKGMAFESQKGTSRISRMGEQYLMTCRCGASAVSSEESKVSDFFRGHYLVH